MSYEPGRVNAFDREVPYSGPWRRNFDGAPYPYVWIGDILPEIYGNPLTRYSIPLEPPPPPLGELPEIEEQLWHLDDGPHLDKDSEKEVDEENPPAARSAEEAISRPRRANAGLSDCELMPPPPRPMGPSRRPEVPAAGEDSSAESATRQEDASEHEETHVVEEKPFVYVGSDPRYIDRQLKDAMSGKLRTTQLLCPCGEETTETTITCSNVHEYETWYHLSCAGLSREPPDEVAWYCAECVSNGYEAYKEEAVGPETDVVVAAPSQPAIVAPTAARKTVPAQKSAAEASIQVQPSAPSDPMAAAKGKASAKSLPNTLPRQRQRSEGRASAPPKSGPRTKGKPWTDEEETACIFLMKDIKTNQNVPRIDMIWGMVSQRLKSDYNIDRSPAAVKNQWNRVLRERSGFDERANKRPDMMRTGELNSAKKRAATVSPTKRQVIKLQDEDIDNDSKFPQTAQSQDYERKRKARPLEDEVSEERELPQVDRRKRRRVLSEDDEAEEREELPDVNPMVKKRTRFSVEEVKQQKREQQERSQFPLAPTTASSRKRRRETPVIDSDDDNEGFGGYLSKPTPQKARARITSMEEADAAYAAQLQAEEYRLRRPSRSGSETQGRH